MKINCAISVVAGLGIAWGSASMPLHAAEGLNEPPEGFTALFNGEDLTGWHGLVANPQERAEMSQEELARARREANQRMRRHWEVEDGVLRFDGEGKSLVTAEAYADFELHVDWKITEGGDSGIYLRGTPQVQIWDPGDSGVGSGGLYNNQDHPSEPLTRADHPIGEWNTFRIRMVGRHVWVWLNDELVVPGVVMENYWDRDKPIDPVGAIELQSHGTPLAFRNIFIKELVTADQAQRIEEALPTRPRVEPAAENRVLIWTRAAGFRHQSIPHGARTMEALGLRTGAYEAVISDNLLDFLPERLAEFDAVILNNTTGRWTEPQSKDLERWEGTGGPDELEQAIQESLVRFVREGGGLAGYHSASDANYNWAEFGRMIGGYFDGHPWHEKVGVSVEEPDHPLMAAFDGQGFSITDEIYQFRGPYSRDRLRVLLSLDPENTDMEKDGIHREDGDFAVSWVQGYGEGKVFYSSLGHRPEIFWNASVLEYYRDGIQFVLGDLEAPTAPRRVQARKDGDRRWIKLTDPALWSHRDGWEFQDDEIALEGGGHGSIWTRDRYEDFVLDLEFKMSENCNSGIFFRANPDNPVHEGFEIQVLDSHGKEEAGKHDCGALYDVVAPKKNVTRPAGEWNHLRLRCEGPLITVRMNDEKVVQADISRWTEPGRNPDGSENKFRNALADLPRKNHIGFQDHGHPVWYRDVKITPLD